jgi:hypothetical protein
MDRQGTKNGNKKDQKGKNDLKHCEMYSQGEKD